MKLLVSPHNDDETLFAAFTALREKPLVVMVFDSYVQPGRGIPGTEMHARRGETIEACKILGVEVDFLGYRDDIPATTPAAAETLQDRIRKDLAAYGADQIWAPAFEFDGHRQHNLVANACHGLNVAARYLTYTTKGKSVGPRKVEIEDPNWIALKLRALSEYRSQFHPATGCAPHFIARSLEEYYA